ncbi:MAG: SPFH domain-containing protein [Verrucomicrobia bacterium]|nr:SPFH domain-containing protein [Verrucomicrobiota bacterium]
MKQMPAAIFVLLVIALGLAGVVFLGNSQNVRVSAGYASYVYSKPIFGRSVFKSVLIGPASTGLRWRLSGQSVSITPYTYSEKFEGNTAILAQDKLPLNSQAHIVWRLKPDEASVKHFMEEFGGWENTGEPDEIAKQAYAQFIQEPFRTVTRSVVAKYGGLSVNESLPEISTAISDIMKEMLKSTPFEILSVVMGNAAPPQQVIDAIATKVALNQTLEQKAIEEQIATKMIEIERKNGEAAGAKSAAEAVERAKAISSISAVLTPAYIQYLGMENIRGADRVYVPLGGASPQLVLPVK